MGTPNSLVGEIHWCMAFLLKFTVQAFILVKSSHMTNLYFIDSSRGKERYTTLQEYINSRIRMKSLLLYFAKVRTLWGRGLYQDMTLLNRAL